MPTISKRIWPTGAVSYQAKVRVKGYQPVTATFDRKTDAVKWAQRTEADIREGKYFPNTKAKKNTVTDLIDRYLEYLKAANHRRHDEVLHLLHWWKMELGHIVLAHFKSEDVEKAQQKLFVRQRLKKDSEGNSKPVPISPSTINRYMVALQTAVNYGIKPLKWISNNPVSELDKLEEPEGIVRFLSEEEKNNLITACRESKDRHLFTIVLLGIATGARKNEIRTMRWAHVNADCSLVTLPKTKNKKVRAVSLSGAAQQLVKKMREERAEGQAFLFPSPDDPAKPLDFRSAWRFAVEKAGVKNFRFHDLRHSFASYLAMNNASTLVIADAMGHKTLAMVQRYAHLAPSHTSNIVAQMAEKELGHVEI